MTRPFSGVPHVLAAGSSRPEDRSVHELLTELLQRVARIEVDLGRLVPAPRLSRADRLALTNLVPAIYAEFPATPFVVRDLLQSLPLRSVCAGWTGKRLGKLLARSAGVPMINLLIEPMGEEGHVKVWRVVSLGVSGVFSGFNAA